MKVILQIVISIIFILTCLSCATEGQKFFEYDEIEHYSSDFDEKNLKFLFDNQPKSEIDSLKAGVILNDIPANVNDLYFLNKLNKIGFKKNLVDKSKFSSIDNLFREKKVAMSVALSCIHLYRDILIFKKQKKVIGTAKICFSCMDHQIRGTNANTENFGQNGDYQKLEKILRN